MVLEGKQLDIELHSPAMNLLGFEHHASSPEQRALVKNVNDILVNAKHLFSFGSAQCQLVDRDVNVNHLLDDGDHHDTDSHDKESHDEEPFDQACQKYRYKKQKELAWLNRLLNKLSQAVMERETKY